MASLIFLLISLVVLVRKHDCAGFSRMDQQKRMKEMGFQYIVKKIMNPLRKLTAELPNHNIEMEIEILDPVRSSKPTTQTQRRRLFRIFKRTDPKRIARSMNGIETTASSTDLTSADTPIPPTSPPPPSETETEPTTTMAITTMTTDNIPENKPIYMEDLNKAMSDLEERLLQKSSSPNTSKATPRGLKKLSLEQQPPLDKKLENIMSLLQKAVYVDSNVQPPNNNNLDWVQLKIPKGIL